MDTEEMMCNRVGEALLELGKPSTVSELASHLNVDKDRVQRALISLKETGFIVPRDDRWLMAGWPEDIAEDTNLKVSAQKWDLDSMEMRSRPPERDTHQKVSALADHLGGLRMTSHSPERGKGLGGLGMRSRSPERGKGLGGLGMRSRSPERGKGLGGLGMTSGSPKRGAACPEKYGPSPDEKLQGRPVGQKDSSNSVVAVMERSNLSSSPKVYALGSSNLEIETRKPLQCVQVSDPGVQENIDKISSIIKCLERESLGLEAKDISRKCKFGDAKRFVNPLLYHLEKKQVVISEQVPGTHKKIWKLGPKKATDQQLIEYAAEKSNTTRKGTVGSSVTASNELHLHNHYHQHTHNNYIQIGEVNTMTVPQELEERKRGFERSAEDGVK